MDHGAPRPDRSHPDRPRPDAEPGETLVVVLVFFLLVAVGIGLIVM